MRHRLALSAGAAIVLAALLAPPARAAASSDALALVPSDAAVVGFVRAADLRSNPFQLRIFEETDKLTTNGDAAKFLAEAGLDLRNDVDAVVFSTTSTEGKSGRSLVIFQGRFHPDKLTAALTQRGAEAGSGVGGAYLRLPDSGSARGSNAVAFLGPNLLVAGNEKAVVSALGDHAAGGGGFSSGAGLGRELRRVDPSASAWLLFDVARCRQLSQSAQSTHNEAAAGLFSALKSVSLVTMQANIERDALAIKATGISADEETRSLLEDALRGVTAAWRMAAQEKHPELVATIRQFKVERNGEGVTISGTIPGDVIRSVSAQHRAAR